MTADFKLGDRLVRPRQQRIEGTGGPTHTDFKSMAVLCALAEDRGQVVSRQDLMDRIWPETHVSEDVLNVAISNLRRILEDDPKNPTFIQTVPRQGYRLIAEVSNGETKPLERNPHPFIRMIAYLLPAIGFLAMAFVGLYFFRSRPVMPIESIAVLPFENYSFNPEDEYLADGMTEALITSLAKLGGPKVISRTSSMTYKNTDKPLPQIAQELGIDAVLEGSVQKENGKIRISVQLVDATGDTHLWSHSYLREFSDVLGLQSDIAAAVAGQVGAQLEKPSHGRALPKIDSEAYDAFLKGRYFRNREGLDDYLKAEALFAETLRLAPEFAPAHAALAETYFMLAEIGARPSKEAFELGKASAMRALEGDPALAEAHLVRAISLFGLEWEFEEADRAFQRALSLNGQDPVALHWYARYLTVMGRFDEAIQNVRRIQEIDPAAYTRLTLVNVLSSAGRFNQALNVLEQMRAVSPKSPQVWAGFSSLYEGMGRLEEAFSAFQNYMRFSGMSPQRVAAMTRAFEEDGPQGVYRLLFAAYPPSNTYGSPVVRARNLIQMGDVDEAWPLLETGYRERDMMLLWLGVDHRFEPIRGEPRYLALVDKLGVYGGPHSR